MASVPCGKGCPARRRNAGDLNVADLNRRARANVGPATAMVDALGASSL